MHHDYAIREPIQAGRFSACTHTHTHTHTHANTHTKTRTPVLFNKATYHVNRHENMDFRLGNLT